MFAHNNDAKPASRIAKRIVAEVEPAMAGDIVDWDKLMQRMPFGEEWELKAWAKARLSSLPEPLFEDQDDALVQKRRSLERFIAEIYMTEGDAEPLICALRDDLLKRGESASLLLSLLADVGRVMEVWVLAKYALDTGAVVPSCEAGQVVEAQ